jgi:ketopantoate reductase
VQAALGSRPLIVSLQNGIRAQQVLPRYYPRVVYSVVAYNACSIPPTASATSAKGRSSSARSITACRKTCTRFSALLGQGLEVRISANIRDAAYCKLALNMTNAVTTCWGWTFKNQRSRLYQNILAGAIYEAVQVIGAAGVREQDLSPLPPGKPCGPPPDCRTSSPAAPTGATCAT